MWKINFYIGKQKKNTKKREKKTRSPGIQEENRTTVWKINFYIGKQEKNTKKKTKKHGVQESRKKTEPPCEKSTLTSENRKKTQKKRKKTRSPGIQEENRTTVWKINFYIGKQEKKTKKKVKKKKVFFFKIPGIQEENRTTEWKSTFTSENRKKRQKKVKEKGDFPKFRESRKKTGPPCEKSTFTSENRKKRQKKKVKKKKWFSKIPGIQEENRTTVWKINFYIGKQEKNKKKKKVKKMIFQKKKVCLHMIVSRFLKQWILFYLPVFHFFWNSGFSFICLLFAFFSNKNSTMFPFNDSFKYIYIIIVFWLVDVCECLSWYYDLWIYDMFFVIQYVIWSNWIFDNCLSGTSCEDPVISSYIIYYSNRSWWDTPSLPGLLFFIEPGTTTLSHEVLVGLPGIGWKTGLLYLVEWGLQETGYSSTATSSEIIIFHKPKHTWNV